MMNDSLKKEPECLFVELTTKQDGNTNPVMICLADIAVIQAEGILSGNTKIILRGSGKAIQIPESYCEVKEKFFDALNGQTVCDDAENSKRYELWKDASYNGKKVFLDRKTKKHYGVVDVVHRQFYCVPVTYYGLKDFRPETGETVLISQEDYVYG